METGSLDLPYIADEPGSLFVASWFEFIVGNQFPFSKPGIEKAFYILVPHGPVKQNWL